MLGKTCTDHFGEAGDCLCSTPASLSQRPVSAMWLFQPANRRAFPIPAPGQVGGWGRKPAVLITFPPRERLSECVGASGNFKVNVEGPLVLAEDMTQPLGCGVCVKRNPGAERPEGGVPKQDCFEAFAFPAWLTDHLAQEVPPCSLGYYSGCWAKWSSILFPLAECVQSHLPELLAL